MGDPARAALGDRGLDRAQVSPATRPAHPRRVDPDRVRSEANRVANPRGLNQTCHQFVPHAPPDDLDLHRESLRAARAKRIELLTSATRELVRRLDEAAADANERVLLNPISARTVVTTRNKAGGSIAAFQQALGLAEDGADIEAKRWREAVGDARDKLMEGGEAGLAAAKEIKASTARTARALGEHARERARILTHRVSSSIAERTGEQQQNPSESGDHAESPGSP